MNENAFVSFINFHPSQFTPVWSLTVFATLFLGRTTEYFKYNFKVITFHWLCLILLRDHSILNFQTCKHDNWPLLITNTTTDGRRCCRRTYRVLVLVRNSLRLGDRRGILVSFHCAERTQRWRWQNHLRRLPGGLLLAATEYSRGKSSSLLLS